MTERSAIGERDESGGIAKALKRRGILAAAGAVVAGIVAKQVARPADAYVGNSDGGTLIIGANTSFGVTPVSRNTETVPTELVNLSSTVSVSAGMRKGTGLVVTGSDGTEGIRGFCNGPFAAGLYGESNQGYGVFGSLSGGPTYSGGSGVYGQSNGNGRSFGVTGTAAGVDSIGVYGLASNGSGVYGATNSTSGAAGVYGISATSYGIVGATSAAAYSGVTGITSTPGTAALAATSTVSSAFAAYFTGPTYVQGDFAVSGNKSVAVMHPDGTHRLLYCIESPEAWFEDFGKSQLLTGKADVKLDPDFAALVQANDYHVFLTTYGTSQGLDVIGQHPGGFSVQERNKGASSITFSWRVVAKRKGNPGKRLERFTPPKINTPDIRAVPKPEPPKKP